LGERIERERAIEKERVMKRDTGAVEREIVVD